jgi:heme oxygenase (mycobilin-producing)
MDATLPGVPGLRQARLLRPREPGRGYLSILEFADDTAYAAYRASNAFHAAHNWPDHAPIDHSQLTTYNVHTEITCGADNSVIAYDLGVRAD